MNNLIYNARMALRDIMEVNIFTKGNDRVYLTVFPDLVWEGTVEQSQEQEGERNGQEHTKKIILNVVEHLRDMDMVLADGDEAVNALLKSEAVEIVRKPA